MPDPSTARSSARERPARSASRRITALVGVLVVVAGVSAGAVAGSRALERERHDQVVLDGPIDRVIIDVDRGDVEVMAMPDRRVRSVSLDRSLAWRIAEPRVSGTVSEGELRLGSRCPRSVPVASACWVDHRVEVPRGTSVEVRVGRGSVTLDGLDATVVVRTHRSPVRATAIGAHEAVVTSDGGAVALSFVDPPSRLVVASGGGDVDLELPGGPYDLDLATSGGAAVVEIDVRPHAEPVLTVASDGGSVHLRPSGRSTHDAQR
jgi:hypothetical protein